MFGWVWGPSNIVFRERDKSNKTFLALKILFQPKKDQQLVLESVTFISVSDRVMEPLCREKTFSDLFRWKIDQKPFALLEYVGIVKVCSVQFLYFECCSFFFWVCCLYYGGWVVVVLPDANEKTLVICQIWRRHNPPDITWRRQVDWLHILIFSVAITGLWSNGFGTTRNSTTSLEEVSLLAFSLSSTAVVISVPDSLENESL